LDEVALEDEEHRDHREDREHRGGETRPHRVEF